MTSLCTFPYSLRDTLAYYINGKWVLFIVCKFGTQVAWDYACKRLMLFTTIPKIGRYCCPNGSDKHKFDI